MAFKKEIYRALTRDLSFWLLLVTNGFVIYQVIANELAIIDVVLIYFVQSLIIGVFGALKILTLSEYTMKDPASSKTLIGSAMKPKVVYAAQLVFVFAFFHFIYYLFISGAHSGEGMFGKVDLTEWWTQDMQLVILALVVNHLISFLLNLRRDRDRVMSLTKAVGIPLMRVVPMHLALIFGGFLITTVDEQPGFQVVLMLLLIKTVIDLGCHVLEHSTGAKDQ